MALLEVVTILELSKVSESQSQINGSDSYSWGFFWKRLQIKDNDNGKSFVEEKEVGGGV